MNAADEFKLRKWIDLGHRYGSDRRLSDSAENDIAMLMELVSEYIDGDEEQAVLSMFPLLLERVRELERDET